MDWMPQAINEGIMVILIISGPLVILAAALGLTIGIIQAATQVQEQTLGSAVKIIGLFIAIILFGFYMFQYITKYTRDNVMRAFSLVPQLGEYLKPRKNFLNLLDDKDKQDISLPNIDEAQNANDERSASGAMSGQAKNIINDPDIKPEFENNTAPVLDNKIPRPPSEKRPKITDYIKQDMPSTKAKTEAKKPTPVKKTAPKPAPVKKPAAQSKTKPSPTKAQNTAATVKKTAPKPAPVKKSAPVTTAPPPVATSKPKVKRRSRRSLSDKFAKIKNNSILD